MKYLLTASQSKKADLHAMEEMGIPSLVLMERAALAVTEEIIKTYGREASILVAAGSGNNGGDGIAVARMLYEKGYKPDILTAGNPEKYSPQVRQQLEMITYYEPSFVSSIEKNYDLIIDALFGFGLTRNVEGRFADLIRQINENPAKVLSVDIPSGISTDQGQVMGIAVKAELTVTISAGKPGLYLDPGRQYAGQVMIREIGIPKEPVLSDEAPTLIMEKEDLSGLAVRDEAGNKGSFSKVLVVAGSEKMFGAAYLSAMSALKSGAGMVKVFTEEKNRTAFACLMPEALMSTYDCKGNIAEIVDQLKKDLQWADVSLIGPGLDQTVLSERLLFNYLFYNEKPFVMDADALNLIGKNPDWWQMVDQPCIITPHIGEMSRLTGKSTMQLKADPLTAARDFAASHRIVCVMKDARSVIAGPDGKAFINCSGNSALATAGSGDVLAGLITGLLGQWEKGFHLTEEEEEDRSYVAAAGAFLHGKTGEKAAKEHGKQGVTAGLLLNYFWNESIQV